MLFLTVGHLPRELSQIAKFTLDRGVKVIATLTSTNFCRSHLVQAGLEIACKVTVKIPAAIKKPHDFGSIQRIGKRLLRNVQLRKSWFFLGNHFAWFSSTNTKISKRYTLPFLFNSSSSDSICHLGDYCLKGNDFGGN